MTSLGKWVLLFVLLLACVYNPQPVHAKTKPTPAPKPSTGNVRYYNVLVVLMDNILEVEAGLKPDPVPTPTPTPTPTQAEKDKQSPPPTLAPPPPTPQPKRLAANVEPLYYAARAAYIQANNSYSDVLVAQKLGVRTDKVQKRFERDLWLAVDAVANMQLARGLKP